MSDYMTNYKKWVESILKEDFLNKKGKQRMTPALKEEFESICANNEHLKEIAQVREELNHGTWC